MSRSQEQDPPIGMTALDRDKIISLFTKKERKSLKLPGQLNQLDWDSLDFLGWNHPSGHLSYVVYEYNDQLEGVVLTPTRVSNKINLKVCSWCSTLQYGSNVTLFAASSDQKGLRTIGDYICSDLQCSLYIRGLKSAGLAPIEESLTVSQKVDRLRLNLDKFFHRLKNLGSSQ